jgi:hypothetical protein
MVGKIAHLHGTVPFVIQLLEEICCGALSEKPTAARARGWGRRVGGSTFKMPQHGLCSRVKKIFYRKRSNNKPA